jgi:hypothetical protein
VPADGSEEEDPSQWCYIINLLHGVQLEVLWQSGKSSLVNRLISCLFLTFYQSNLFASFSSSIRLLKWYVQTSFSPRKVLTTLQFLPRHATLQLLARQSTSSTSCNGVSGGAVAGIVIGTIAGTLLVLWLIYTARTTASSFSAESSVGRGSPSHHRSRRGNHSTYVDRRGYSHRVREPARVYYKPE